MLANLRQRLFRAPQSGPYPWVRWLYLFNAFLFGASVATGWDNVLERLYRVGMPLVSLAFLLLFAAETLPLRWMQWAGYLRLVALVAALVGFGFILSEAPGMLELAFEGEW